MNTRTQIGILLALCLCTFFVNLGLFEPDLMESRNFITAREMVTEGHWLNTTMNGEPRLEKQPLPTWLTAWAAIAGGDMYNLVLMRLPSAIIAMLMVLFFFGLCRELNRDENFALTGALVLGSSLLVVQMARVNSWDIYTHAFMVGALWLAVRAWNRPGMNWALFMASGVMMGLSLFSKGPVALYAMWIPFMVGWLWFGDRSAVKKKLWPFILSIIIAVCVGFAWNFYIYIEAHGELAQVVNKEATSWANRHVRPFYFYLHFALYSGVWVLLLLAAMVVPAAHRRVRESGNYGMVLAWLLVSIFLLSVIPEKKERYLLPTAVPMALMVAMLVHGIFKAYAEGKHKQSDVMIAGTHGLLMLTAWVALPLAAWWLTGEKVFGALGIMGILVSIKGILFTLRAVLNLRSGREEPVRKVFLSSVMLVATVTVFFLPSLRDAVYRNTEFEDPAVIRQYTQLDEIPFVSTQPLNMKLIWQVGKPVRVVDPKTFSFENAGEVIYFSHTPPTEALHYVPMGDLKISEIGVFDYTQEKRGDYKLYVARIGK